MKSILAAFFLCCCVATKQTFPTDTAKEKLWKEQYTKGEISWSQYQERLNNETP